MILGLLPLRTVAGSAVPRGSGGGYSCSWVPLALLHRDRVWTAQLSLRLSQVCERGNFLPSDQQIGQTPHLAMTNYVKNNSAYTHKNYLN